MRRGCASRYRGSGLDAEHKQLNLDVSVCWGGVVGVVGKLHCHPRTAGGD